MTSSSDRKGQVLFIIERAVEYFISIITGGAYLAKVTSAIGMSQGLTGILTSFVSLGAVFQIFALFLAQKRRPKRFVLLLHTINQLAFVLVYLIPLANVPTVVKHVFFIAFLLIGNILNNVVASPKTSWEMSFVGENEKGIYTAKKEITSLFCGIAFSYLVSFVIDYFEAKNLNVAFVISAVAIFLLTVWHSLTILKTEEREIPVPEEKVSFVGAVKMVFLNKPARKVVIAATLYQIINCAVISFFGTYTASPKEDYGLGFSMSFIALTSMLYAIVRAVASRPIGKFADKRSFKTSSMLCYGILAAALLCGAFITPSNGKVTYTVYYLFYAVALAGLSSAIINLLYEEVKPDQRMCAFAVQQSLSGLIGFLSAVVAGIFVDYVKTLGGTLCGLYAQQWLSVFGVALCIITLLYIRFFLKSKSGTVED